MRPLRVRNAQVGRTRLSTKPARRASNERISSATPPTNKGDRLCLTNNQQKPKLLTHKEEENSKTLCERER